MKILIVEDDVSLMEVMAAALRKDGYIVECASGFHEAVQKLGIYSYDCILLDIMLPGGSGLDLLSMVRKPATNTNVIIISAKDSIDDKVAGLELGADDYLPKPFLPKELLLRVQAILHRTYPEPHRTVELAASTVDLEKAEVWKNGERLPLTAKELQLFQKLYENAGRIVTTGILCETICGEFWQGYESTLSTHIRHLREKIEENPSKPVSLVTAKGLGYRLNLKGAKS